ncbi:MAG: hypothetical protein FWG68_01625 [Defluviitaleaceae bacterium]|nr:hypothetical protein [Defluviitaleaceae bacterium]
MEDKMLSNCDGTFWVPAKGETFEDFIARLEKKVEETKKENKQPDATP